MKIEIKREVTTSIKEEIQIPSFRKSESRHTSNVELFALVNLDGANYSITGYRSKDYNTVSKRLFKAPEQIGDIFLKDFTKAEEISEEDFWSAYYEIKDLL